MDVTVIEYAKFPYFLWGEEKLFMMVILA